MRRSALLRRENNFKLSFGVDRYISGRLVGTELTIIGAVPEHVTLEVGSGVQKI